MDRFNPVRAAELIASGEVTALVGVPAVFAAILQAFARRGEAVRGTRLRLCICGGAPLPPEIQDAWAETTGVELRQGYGLTEAGPVCLFNRVQLPNRRGSLGVPFPGVRVSVRSPDHGVELPSGTVGEICVAGDNLFSGYVHDGPGLRREGAWLHTGDLGAMDADGYVSFHGLHKPMFTRSGFNIYPAEIERAVAEMPGVRAVRVRAIPNPARENDIALDVEGTVSDAAVKAWCELRLSSYKQPSEVRIVA
jgi:long-chain acyl-CoA synthetase